jgi:hypothetical protein
VRRRTVALSDLTHDDLDRLADVNDVDGYRRSGTKAEKVAVLAGVGITADDATVPDDTDVGRSGTDLPFPPVSPTLTATADSERLAAAAYAERRATLRTVRDRPATVSDRTRKVAEQTAEREAEGAGEVARIIADRAAEG